MPSLLHLDSSADATTSTSRALTAAFADAFRAADPANTVVYRDVHADPLPHLADASLHWPASHYNVREGMIDDAFRAADPANTVVYRDVHADPLPHLADASLHWPVRLRPTPDTTPPADDASLQQALIEELLAADVLLVGAPMYNYSLPSSLKAWVDHVHVPGLTAPFDVPSQPLAGRPAVVVSSRGASYDPGSPTDGWDHAVPVLQLILGQAFGMAVTVVTTSLTLAATVPALVEQRPRSEAEYAAALAEVTRLGAELGAPDPDLNT